jgi:predicted nucleic acid-binding protein
VRFVDTSFWVALRFRRDDHHAVAAALWADRPPALITTNLVIGETWTFLRRRTGHAEAVTFLDAVQGTPRVSIVSVAAQVEAAAWAWLRRHDERDYSFVDATSFEVMRQQRMREALAFDGDFTAAGFIEVRPASATRAVPR